jgi:NAD(P)-dependent dehydrogenase (short-subunit alcohol dehydrogenase family)
VGLGRFGPAGAGGASIAEGRGIVYKVRSNPDSQKNGVKKMSGILEGKTALVTGGGSGIGRATAMAFAREGARVAIVDYVPEGGKQTLNMIKEIGDGRFVQADVSKPDEIKRAVEQTVEAFGRLDCAFNNAGIEGAGVRDNPWDAENWNRVIAINLTGVFLSMQHEITQMLKQGGGAIVNTSSILGLVGIGGAFAYTAAKHGVAGLTKAAALAYAQSGIRVNAVCPGYIHTPMVERSVGIDSEFAHHITKNLQPIGRLGRPEEIAEAVVWLCSPRASLVTGITMPVDGGCVAQ